MIKVKIDSNISEIKNYMFDLIKNRLKNFTISIENDLNYFKIDKFRPDKYQQNENYMNEVQLYVTTYQNMKDIISKLQYENYVEEEFLTLEKYNHFLYVIIAMNPLLEEHIREKILELNEIELEVLRAELLKEGIVFIFSKDNRNFIIGFSKECIEI